MGFGRTASRFDTTCLLQALGKSPHLALSHLWLPQKSVFFAIKTRHSTTHPLHVTAANLFSLIKRAATRRWLRSFAPRPPSSLFQSAQISLCSCMPLARGQPVVFSRRSDAAPHTQPALIHDAQVVLAELVSLRRRFADQSEGCSVVLFHAPSHSVHPPQVGL